MTVLVVGILYAGLLSWSVGVVGAHAGRRPLAIVCTVAEELCLKWARDFTELTGIEAATTRMSTGEALSRLSREDGMDEFDVWHGGPADVLATARQRGLLVPYRSAAADAVLTPYRDGQGFWTGVSLGILAFCSNTRILDALAVPVPRSWDDLLDQRLRGRVSVPNALSSGTGYTIVWTQRLRFGTDGGAIHYLRRLDESVLQYTNAGLAPARVAGRGEAAVAITLSHHCVQAHDEGHTDLRVSFPEGGTGYEIEAVAILTGARDLVSAHAYIDYAVSRQAQGTTAGAIPAMLPTRVDLVPDPRLRGSSPLFPYAPEQAAESRDGLLARVVREVYR